jgi:hypothetical protein
LQQRAIDLLKVAIAEGTDKSMVQLLKDAGYAPRDGRTVVECHEGSEAPQTTYTRLDGDTQRPDTARDGKKVSKASYKDLTRAHEVMTYAFQLLGGKPTHNIPLSAEHGSNWKR